jgi:hypothetical protein
MFVCLEKEKESSVINLIYLKQHQFYYRLLVGSILPKQAKNSAVVHTKQPLLC